MTQIVQSDDDVLRTKAAPVSATEFDTPELNEVITAMQEALHDTPDGVAIAAPQIGFAKRIFVVAGAAYDQAAGIQPDETARHNDGVYINPEIIKKAKDIEYMEEGCLSVRNYYGYVPRATKVTVRAQDEHGATFTDGRGGLLAQIFQHEIDHLDGVLFTDKAQDVEYRAPNEQSS